MDLGHGHYDGGKLAAPSRFRDIGLEWGSLQAAMGRMNLNIPPRTAGYAVPPRFQTQAALFFIASAVENVFLIVVPERQQHVVASIGMLW